MSIHTIKKLNATASPPTTGESEIPMNAVAREEFEAKLQAIEARMDARVASIDGKFEAMLARIQSMNETLVETKAAFNSVKTTVVVTGVSAVLAVLFGIASFNASLLNNMISSFDSGRETASAITAATVELQNTQEKLKDIERSLGTPGRTLQEFANPQPPPER